jgi:hypothetical protein
MYRIYRPGTPFKKYPGFYNAYVIDGSFFQIHETKVVKHIKDMYSPHFSRAAIQKLEGSIHEKVHKLLDALHKASKESKVIDLTLAFKCLTADVVMEYCYQKNFGALDAADFHFKIIEDMEGLFATASYTWYFPNLFNMLCRVLERAPISVTKTIAKPLAASIEVYKVCRSKVSKSSLANLSARLVKNESRLSRRLLGIHRCLLFFRQHYSLNKRMADLHLD